MSICPIQNKKHQRWVLIPACALFSASKIWAFFLVLEIGKVFIFLQILQLQQCTFLSFHTKNEAQMNVLAVRKHRKDKVYSSSAFSGSYVV